MNTGKKVIIALGVIGLVFICLGAVMGGNISSFATMFSEAHLPEGVLNPAEMATNDVNNMIHGVELNLNNSTINVKYGERFELSGTGNFNSYIKDGVFYCGSDDTKYSANVLGMDISVPSKWVCGYGSYVLTIPENISLDTITFHTFNSSIAADTLPASQLNIDMTLGDLTINHALADSVSIKVNGGKATISNPVIVDSANIEASGEISLGGESSMENVLNNISLSSSRGDITLSSAVTGNAEIKSGWGDITATLPGSNTNYTLNAQKGDLNISPTAGSETSDDHLADISFSCDHGSASVNFQ